MNTKLILVAISAIAFSSCATMYKTGQTPDDVYYSPARPSGGSGEEKKEQSETARYYDDEYRSVRLGMNDRRYRYLDYNYGFDPYLSMYSYNPYMYGYNYDYYYNPYFWPYPIYSVPVYGKPVTPKNTTPRIGNLSGYSPVYSNGLGSIKTGGTRPMRSYNNSNKGSAMGNAMRQIFSPGTNRTSTNNSVNSRSLDNNNTRTYTPSTSSSSRSSSGSSSSGSGGITRPSRN